MRITRATFAQLARGLVPAFLLLGLGPALGTALAELTTYEITPAAKGNRVEFLSKAPLESFKGHTNVIRGEITCDPSRLGDSVAVYVEVDLASMTTGMKLRDQHMRENHLETDLFPAAIFRGARLRPGSAGQLRSGETAEFALAATFELHGHSRPIEVTATIHRADDGSEALSIACDFIVNLSDYEIRRPKFLVMKLGDAQEVSVEFEALPVGSDR